MQRHNWRNATEEGIRLYRAEYHAGRWTLQSQLKGEEDWAPHDPISTGEWRTLREILWRKYQRKRCPWKLIEKIDKLLEEQDESENEGEAE